MSREPALAVAPWDTQAETSTPGANAPLMNCFWNPLSSVKIASFAYTNQPHQRPQPARSLPRQGFPYPQYVRVRVLGGDVDVIDLCDV